MKKLYTDSYELYLFGLYFTIVKRADNQKSYFLQSTQSYIKDVNYLNNVAIQGEKWQIVIDNVQGTKERFGI